jgi:hypothetical protein
MPENNNGAHDKIRILLVDDEPNGLRRPDDPSAPNVPELGEPYKQYFDFRWLATPEEAREYCDLSLDITRRNPKLLGRDGWIPEILSIDYALTQDRIQLHRRPGVSAEWYAKLSPLPSLRTIASSLGIETEKFIPKEGELDPLLKSLGRGNEFWGCFVGGSILSSLSDHPCGPVTVTKFSQETIVTTRPDAAFFEWFMTFKSGGLLKAKGLESSPPWETIICEGVKNLQERIKQLAKHGIITLHLNDLLQLSHHKNYPLVTFTSRYGTRRLLIQGLFINERDEQTQQESAKKWASDIMRDALSCLASGQSPSQYTTTLNEVEEGLRKAKQLWELWESDQLPAYLEFSRVMGQAYHALKVEKRELDEKENSELDEWCSKHGLVLTNVVSSLRSKKYTLPGTHESEIRNLRCSNGAIRRWAVLFTITRLACMAHHASLAISEDVIISEHDVFLALFPLAKNLPYYLHEKTETGEHKKDLKELCRNGSFSRGQWGDIGISVSDILDGANWDSNSHGVFPFERRVLQMYAASHGCGDKQGCENDPVLTNLLLGKPR